jgi:hypothetical protein
MHYPKETMNGRTDRKLRFGIFIAVGLSVALLAAGCASGPRPPQKGTPAFYWQAALEAYNAGDFVKTNEHLSRITRTDNEYRTRAQAWQLVLASGLAKGYMEIADAFENGARQNKANPTPFRKQVSASRTAANSLALQVAETFKDFQEKNKDGEVVLAFPFPAVSPAPVPQLVKAGAGMMVPPEELAIAEKRATQKAVLMTTCRVAGAPEDVARTQELFKAGEVKIPRAQFVTAVASSLYDQGQLYSRTKLDQPERMKLFYVNALDAMKTVPESKESKALVAKLQSELKKK